MCSEEKRVITRSKKSLRVKCLITNKRKSTRFFSLLHFFMQNIHEGIQTMPRSARTIRFAKPWEELTRKKTRARYCKERRVWGRLRADSCGRPGLGFIYFEKRLGLLKKSRGSQEPRARAGGRRCACLVRGFSPRLHSNMLRGLSHKLSRRILNVRTRVCVLVGVRVLKRGSVRGQRKHRDCTVVVVLML